jgi:hypothetical protein
MRPWRSPALTAAALQFMEPAKLYLPLPQVPLQLDEMSPLALPKVPAGQGVQADDPAVL